jgi:hypothetical protein
MTGGNQRLSARGAHELTIEDLRGVLLGDNSDVRAQFLSHFGQLINDFVSHSDRTYDRLRAFGRAVAADDRAAWTEAFLFSAFNSSLTSCHLLVSGFPIPAGNLMRHYGESCAMALLCSHHAIDVFQRINADPAKFPVDSAVQTVRKRRNAELLRVNADAWSVFQSITRWYDTYSHATVFTLATQAKLSERGQAFLGGGFDEFKLDGYRKELTIRVSSMDRLYDMINAAERNVQAAQSAHERRRAQ